jgi:hypothetical protein
VDLQFYFVRTFGLLKSFHNNFQEHTLSPLMKMSQFKYSSHLADCLIISSYLYLLKQWRKSEKFSCSLLIFPSPLKLNHGVTLGVSHYFSREFYQFCFKDIVPHASFLWLWKSKCTPRVKFFGWLVLSDRQILETCSRDGNII